MKAKQKNSKFKEVEAKYEESQKAAKDKIRQEPRKFVRFWKWIWFWISFPFKWIFVNIRDWRTALIFIIVCVFVSSEVWVPYLLAFVFWNNESIRISLLSVASACWLFWIGPGTPFLVICITITIGIKALINKIANRKTH